MKIILSGCSGGGKSTLLALMKERGLQVYTEPGRQIVKEQLKTGGVALPWVNAEKFAEACIFRSLEFYKSASATDQPTLFDRSYIDALSALENINSCQLNEYIELLARYPFHSTVYFTPPWQEIYKTDQERRHSFSESVAEYDRLLFSYEKYGYDIIEIPSATRSARADFLLSAIIESGGKVQSVSGRASDKSFL